jgi:hypothetical protein
MIEQSKINYIAQGVGLNGLKSTSRNRSSGEEKELALNGSKRGRLGVYLFVPGSQNGNRLGGNCMIRTLHGWNSIVFLALVLAFTFPAFGGTIAADYLGGGSNSNFVRATGWFFTPSFNISVTSLGYYDLGALGLTDQHDVGIFLANGTLVASSLIPSGTAATFVPGTVNGTRFVLITPTLLLGGTQYYIEADNNTTDQFAFGIGDVTFAAGITWNGFGDSNSNSIFGTVTNSGGLPGNLGPNFQFAAVPEPSCLILTLGFIGVIGWQRRYSR